MADDTPFRNRIVELRNVRAGDIAANPKNWRRHPSAQRDALRAMLDRIGFVDGVIARETDDGLVLVDGHLRTELDPEATIPVLVVDLDEREADEVLVTLDPLTMLATADGDKLDELVRGLADDDVMVGIMRDVGLESDLLREPEPPPADDGLVPPVADPVSNRGDVWTLGRHRLMCGDSQSAGDVARLLDGATPRLMVTDPPYGVNYDPEWRLRDGVSKGGRFGRVMNDDTTDWSGALAAYLPEVAYVWSPPGDHLVDFARIIQDAGFEIRACLVWRKQTHVLSRGHYHWQHEPCWYAVRKGCTAGWIGDRSQSTVWDITWDANVEGGHSTQKPVECMERPIRNHEGDVYDPFVGAGRPSSRQRGRSGRATRWRSNPATSMRR